MLETSNKNSLETLHQAHCGYLCSARQYVPKPQILNPKMRLQQTGSMTVTEPSVIMTGKPEGKENVRFCSRLQI